MQLLCFFLDKFANFWHTTCLSTANHSKVINVQKWSGFLAHPVYLYVVIRTSYLWRGIGQTQCLFEHVSCLWCFCQDFINCLLTFGLSPSCDGWSRNDVQKGLMGSIVSLRGVNHGGLWGPPPNILLRGPSINRAPNNQAATCHKVTNVLITLPGIRAKHAKPP